MLKLDNYEDTLRSFPHWYDKSPNSNLSKVIRVFNKQYRDKEHKIRTLDFSKRLTKPIHIYKSQTEDYVYEICSDVMLPNIKTINFYVNPLVNNEEEIISYDLKLFKDFYDDGTNTHFNFTYKGDTRKSWDNVTEMPITQYNLSEEHEQYNPILNSYEQRFNETIDDYECEWNNVSMSDFTYENELYIHEKTPFEQYYNIPLKIDMNISTILEGFGNIYLVLKNEEDEIVEKVLLPYAKDENMTINVDNNTISINDEIVKENLELSKPVKIVFRAEFILSFERNEGTENDWRDRFYNITEYHITDTGSYPTQDKKTLPIIPKDTFVLEVLTYDDYRWVKGFPENDQEDLYKIYQEKQSYTDYLTFEINNKQVKDITISKDNIELYKKTLLYRSNEQKDNEEYDSSKPYQIDKYKDVIIADSDKEHTIIHVILSDDDYTPPLFDWTQLTKEYPNIENTYIISDGETVPSAETLDTLVLKRQNNEYNAYKTIQTDNNEYAFIIHWYNVPYTRTLNPHFDLTITQYDKNRPNCPQYDKVITKRYNGNDKTNYDCFTHDYSLDMIGKYWNVPRLTFKQLDYYNHCGKINKEHYTNTYPPYNNRLTEDDYHYEQRIKEYIQKYNKELFPLLELWKNYHVWGTLTSRKDILSVQDESYMQPYDYWEDTIIREESRNKLNIIEGISNEINIDNHIWHEIVVATDIMAVPLGEYRLTYSVSTDNHTDNEGFRIYYYDKKGDCIKEESIRPLYQPTNLLDTYIVDETFTTIKEAVKMNVVVEADNSFYLNNASLVKLTLKDKGAMYMKTKKDYHSCVYDLNIDYNKVPTNINFPSTKVFDRLLQKSLPLTHKGFLNTSYSRDNEDIRICEGFGNFRIENYFDETNNNDSGDYYYPLPIIYLLDSEDNYILDVTFINQEVKGNTNYEEEPYIRTIINFVITDETQQGYHTEIMELPRVIQTNVETTLHESFKIPQNTYSMALTFQSNNHDSFEYKNLSLRRDGEISSTKLWSNQ